MAGGVGWELGRGAGGAEGPEVSYEKYSFLRDTTKYLNFEKPASQPEKQNLQLQIQRTKTTHQAPKLELKGHAGNWNGG